MEDKWGTWEKYFSSKIFIILWDIIYSQQSNGNQILTIRNDY